MMVMVHAVRLLLVVVVVEMIREEVPKVHHSYLDQTSKDCRKARP